LSEILSEYAEFDDLQFADTSVVKDIPTESQESTDSIALLEQNKIINDLKI
jgi:hypothetical protein